MAVIETTMILDPIKDKWLVDSLLTRPDWKIKSQTTTSITFYQILGWRFDANASICVERRN